MRRGRGSGGASESTAEYGPAPAGLRAPHATAAVPGRWECAPGSGPAPGAARVHVRRRACGLLIFVGRETCYVSVRATFDHFRARTSNSPDLQNPTRLRAPLAQPQMSGAAAAAAAAYCAGMSTDAPELTHLDPMAYDAKNVVNLGWIFRSNSYPRSPTTLDPHAKCVACAAPVAVAAP